MSPASTNGPKKSMTLKRARPANENTKETASKSKSTKKSQPESKDDKCSEDDVEENSDSNSTSSGSDSDSESESESEAEVESDFDDDIPQPMKKAKVSAKKESEKFSNAMNALLDTRLKAYDRKDPILARSKKELKKFDDDKLEQKAKRLLLNEKKKRLTANRVKQLLPTDESNAREVLQHEKNLRKTAQRGVIKLFNAILMTQTGTQNDLNNETGIIGVSKKKELVNEISKEKFLSLVQQTGK